MTVPVAECEPAVDDLQRAQKQFLDANRRTDEFLATLGHEMRNPLSALSNALQVWPDALHDPAQMEALRHIMLRQVRQLTRLSDDLLDVARIAHGKLELRREYVELRQLIDGACEEVRPFIDDCGHALTVNVPTEPLVVFGDPSRLLQVFANLIQNAAKFTGRNGSLCITAEPRERMAVVRVRDNGPGIDERLLPAIFEAFTQADGARTSANDGLGIGLRLVKTIVELHGGSVAVWSQGLGRGSEFTVQLPVLNDAMHGKHPAQQQPAAGDDGHSQGLPAHRIVVVDDDRLPAELLAQMLRSIGQDVTVANCGATAIRTVLDARPQVVFLDIVMRGMDGCEVARQLRGHTELPGPVLIALSGNGDEDNKRRAMQAGFDKYLVKPTSIAVLAETLAGIPAAKSQVH